MRSRGDGPSLALPIALVLTAAVAFLPVRYRLHWQQDLSRIVGLPLQPLTYGGLLAADFLRPAPGIRPMEFADDDPAAVLVEELRDRDRLIAALQGENAQLRDRLAQFTGMASRGSDAGRRTLHREVLPVSQRPMRGGLMTLLLRELESGEVLPHPAMIVDPRQLIVLGQVGPGAIEGRQITARPVTADAVGPVRATIHLPTATVADRERAAERLAALRAAGDAAGGEEAAGGGGGGSDDGLADLPDSAVIIARVLLEPDGDGGWTAELGERDQVQVGDRVRVDEATWPDAVRGYELGRVTSVEPKDRSPFGMRIRVEPEVRLADRPAMMFLADLPESWASVDEAGRGEGGGR